MKKVNNAILAKGIAALLAISAISPVAAYAAGTTTAPANAIGIEAAEDAAIKDAGVKREDVTNIRSYLDTDDGRYVYDVDFFVGNVEYEYEVLAEDGTILEQDKEVTNASNTADGQKTDNNKTAATGKEAANTQSDACINAEEAKKIALEDAGLKEDDVSCCIADFDMDDGRAEYEVEFMQGQMEYEYDIDAVTGRILESSSEIDV